MVYRKLLLSIVLSLLASCARAPVVVDSVPTTPDVPSALSTDLDDVADDVATDAQGNAYVVGYRN